MTKLFIYLTVIGELGFTFYMHLTWGVKQDNGIIVLQDRLSVLVWVISLVSTLLIVGGLEVIYRDNKKQG